MPRRLPVPLRRRLARAGITRRQFLTGLAAGVGTLAASALPIMAEGRGSLRRQSNERIAVIGAGVAGLTCAYALEQAGHTVQAVYEAGDRIGGRMHSLDLMGGTGSAEAGGEFIDGWHTEILDLAAALNVPLIERTDFNADGGDVYWFNGERLPERDYLAAWLPVVAAVEADMAHLDGYTDLTHADHPPGAVALDTSAADWYDRHSLDPLARAVVTQALVSAYGRDASSISALLIFYLLEYLATPPLLPERPQYAGRTYQIAGGNQRLCAVLADRLAAPVLLRREMLWLSERGDGCRLIISLPDGDTTTNDFERVIVAIPFPALRRVTLELDLPLVQQNCIESLGYGQNAKLFYECAARPWEQAGYSGEIATDTALQMGWETLHGRVTPNGGIWVNYLGGDAGEALGLGTAAQRTAERLPVLETLFPGFGAAYTGTAHRAAWPAEPLFQGSYACYLPGQLTQYRGVEGQRAGRVHFIGEHTSLAHQGYMNGAVESGLRAARELIDG